jgi:protein-disulfide isomerase
MKVYVLVFTILLSACANNHKDYIAKVGGITIPAAAVDNLVEQELYGAVQRIYFLRKTAAEEMVNQQLFELEAKAQGISKEAYITKEIDAKITPENIEVYIKELSLDQRGIPNINNGYRLVQVRSTEGQELVKEDYRKYLTNKLVQSLQKKYPVEINLQPPAPPAITTSGIPLVHYRGNAKSTITFLEISDLECENCRTNAPLYKEIYEKYKDKVRFGFTHFSGAVTLGATMCEAADKQGKFWQAHDAIFENPVRKTADTSAYLQLMQLARIDTALLRKEISQNTIYQSIRKNISAVKAIKIYATPTVLINGRMVMEPFKKEVLEAALDEAIRKSKD